MTVDRRAQDEESCVFKLSSNKLNTNKKRKPLKCWLPFKIKKSARRGSNPRPPPWQGGAPPLSHSRIINVL